MGLFDLFKKKNEKIVNQATPVPVEKQSSGSSIPAPTELFYKIEYKTPGLHEENIKALLKFIDVYDLWSENDKGYYFWLLGLNSKLLGHKAASCAFYAADTVYRPKTATAAWADLKSEGLVTVTYSLEVANDLHNQLPIPKTMYDIVNYQLPTVKIKEVKPTYYWIKFNTDFGTKTVCARNNRGDMLQSGTKVYFNGYGNKGYAIVDKIIDGTPTTNEIYEI